MTQHINDTLSERAKRYGDFKQNCETTNAFFEVLKNGKNYKDLTAVHIESLHMIFHKISRLVNGDVNYIDNIHDIVGYAKLFEDCINEHNKDDDREQQLAEQRFTEEWEREQSLRQQRENELRNNGSYYSYIKKQY